MAAEEASLRTEIDSTSRGLILSMFPSIPSIRIRGLDSWLMDANPRTFMRVFSPGFPEPYEIFRLGIAPCRACPKLLTGRLSNCLWSVYPTAPIKLGFFCVPYPTTTTSSIILAFSDSSMFIVMPGVTAISCVLCPTYETTNRDFGVALM